MSDEEQWLRELLAGVKAKLGCLPPCSHIKPVLAEQVKRMEQQVSCIDPQGKLPSLLVFAHRSSLEALQAFDRDIDLVVTRTPEKRKAAVTQFLKAGSEEDRLCG